MKIQIMLRHLFSFSISVTLGLSLIIMLMAITIPSQAVSAEADRYNLRDVTPTSKIKQSEARLLPPVYLENESILNNSKSGYPLDDIYTAHDDSRLSFSIHSSYDYEDPSKVLSAEMQYLWRSEVYRDTWYGLQLKQTTGNYNAFADELTPTTADPNADSNQVRFENTQTITSMGFGAGYRFKLLTSFNQHERLFEKVLAFVNYNIVQDKTTSREYRGFGWTAEYAIHYRSGDSYFYGAKLTYNNAAVIREPIDQEIKQDRSLVYGWTSLALQVGYYY